MVKLYSKCRFHGQLGVRSYFESSEVYEYEGNFVLGSMFHFDFAIPFALAQKWTFL